MTNSECSLQTTEIYWQNVEALLVKGDRIQPRNKHWIMTKIGSPKNYAKKANLKKKNEGKKKRTKQSQKQVTELRHQ